MKQPKCILLVDDDPDLVKLFWLILTKEGFEIMTAFDGHLGLEEVREIQPDLILLDIMMPGNLDGIEVCRQVRADPALNQVRIVMVSARNDEETQRAAFRAGADDYWVKPISRDSLIDRVRATLDARQANASRSMTGAAV